MNSGHSLILALYFLDNGVDWTYMARQLVSGAEMVLVINQ